MANTYVAISTATTNSGPAASLNFNSIPQNYTDLIILVSARSTRASATGDQLLYTINGSTANRRFLTIEGRPGTGNPVVSFGDTTVLYVGANPASSSNALTFGNASIYFTNYTGSQNKAQLVEVVQENNITTAYCTFGGNLWSSSEPITSISLYFETAGSNFAQYSTATLYGIKNS